MRRINYKEEIKESVVELLVLEKEQKQSRQRDQVRFVRFLKESQAKTQPAAGALIGLQRRQSQQLWQQYSNQGLVALLSTHYKGSWAKLSSTQQARLLQRRFTLPMKCAMAPAPTAAAAAIFLPQQ